MLSRAELHVHLEGAVEAETLLEIDPSLAREEVAARMAYTDFAGFIQSFVWVNQRLKTSAWMTPSFSIRSNKRRATRA